MTNSTHGQVNTAIPSVHIIIVYKSILIHIAPELIFTLRTCNKHEIEAISGVVFL